MTFNKLYPAALLLTVLACSMLVSPPDDYPPDEDLTAPGRLGNVQASLTVVPRYGNMVPAVRVEWNGAPETDALYYTVERDRGQEEGWDVIGALLVPGTVFADNTLRFPEDGTGIYIYQYRICAFDSAGNKSMPSLPDTVSLITAPLLYGPRGTVMSTRPLFDWESRFNSGKNFRFGLERGTDTLLIADFSPDNFDDFRIRKTYSNLRQLSSIQTGDSLSAGTYTWWVEVRLLPEQAGFPSRTGITVQQFTVQ